MIARMGRPATNSAKKKPATATPKAVSTAFSKGTADEQAAAEAQKQADKRDALKARTAALLEKKQARMAEQAKMNADVETLNDTASSLYGT